VHRRQDVVRGHAERGGEVAAASFASFSFACLGPFWSFLAALAFLSFSFFTAVEVSAARASWTTVLNRSSSKCAYQICIVGIWANWAIASR
jgi:hypothetical protein